MSDYVKNPETDLVYPMTDILQAEMKRYGKLVPCDKNGNSVGKPEVSESGLAAENTELKQRVAELEAEIDMLKAEEKPPEEITEVKIQDDEPNRMDALVNAIGQMERSNPDHFTQGGIPRVEMLEALAGIAEVKASERDEAWKRFNA